MEQRKRKGKRTGGRKRKTKKEEWKRGKGVEVQRQQQAPYMRCGTQVACRESQQSKVKKKDKGTRWKGAEETEGRKGMMKESKRKKRHRRK